MKFCLLPTEMVLKTENEKASIYVEMKEIHLHLLYEFSEQERKRNKREREITRYA